MVQMVRINNVNVSNGDITQRLLNNINLDVVT